MRQFSLSRPPVPRSHASCQRHQSFQQARSAATLSGFRLALKGGSMTKTFARYLRYLYLRCLKVSKVSNQSGT